MALEVHIDLTNETGEDQYEVKLANPQSATGAFSSKEAALTFIREELLKARCDYYFHDVRYT